MAFLNGVNGYPNSNDRNGKGQVGANTKTEALSLVLIICVLGFVLVSDFVLRISGILDLALTASLSLEHRRSNQAE